jgi:hypothetical protein
MLHRTSIWLEYHHFFFRTVWCVFAYKFGGTTSAQSSIPILLILIFTFIHTLVTMCDSSLRVWKNKTLSKNSCYVILEHSVDLKLGFAFHW